MKSTSGTKKTASVGQRLASRTPQGITPAIAAQQLRGMCKGKTTAGKKCRARRILDSSFCFFHDPARKADRLLASSNGGKKGGAQVLSDDHSDVSVQSAGDIELLLILTINQVRKGTIDPRIANAVGYLATVLLKSREQGVVEDRLMALEIMVEKSKGLLS